MTTPCYCAALRLAARKTTAVYDEELAPLDINIAQYSLLRTIARAGSLSLTELGRSTGLDRSTIGRNTGVLQRRGLIATAGGEDARQARVMLTPIGTRLLSSAMPLWQRAQRKIEKSLGPEASDQLRRLLQEL